MGYRHPSGATARPLMRVRDLQWPRIIVLLRPLFFDMKNEAAMVDGRWRLRTHLEILERQRISPTARMS
jgi:hypothetical protein